MERHDEVELLEELVALHEHRSPYLDDAWERAPMARYYSDDVFAKEQERIFKALPQIAAHASEIPDPGSFVTLEMAGNPIFLVRDEAGTARAFYNVCRHRGARLVGETSGCKKRFSCPYHAWTWNSSGKLIGVPHEKSGFPGLNREEFGLGEIPCREYAGWVWVSFAGDSSIDVAQHLGELAKEFDQIGATDHVMFDSSIRDIDCNWKILVEGGIESYHFRVAHRNSIAPLFMDNLSSYRCFDRHMRSVLPRSTLPELTEATKNDWEIRKHSNILYTLFPGSQLLVQEDHFVWIQSFPLAPERTRLRLSTMVPKTDLVEEKQHYWQSHHDMTMRTLDEDFDLGESIQKGLQSGANPHLNFGRFEGALSKFNQLVDEAIA